MAASMASCLVAELFGTFVLVPAVGCNVSGELPFAPTSIACTLIVCIYALGDVSGGHFNPAVSVALGLSQKVTWGLAVAYATVQCVGAAAAGLCFHFLCRGDPQEAQPMLGVPGISAARTSGAEALYTCMLCFTVLCTACARRGQPNTHYGLAIGFTIVAGGHAVGKISGGIMNPAVAVGVLASSGGAGAAALPAVLGGEFVGAGLAWFLFRLVHPEELVAEGEAEAEHAPGLFERCLAEFTGTFYLVLTVGLNVLAGESLAAWSIAASLTTMVYATGCISGGHLNPAVTVALQLRGVAGWQDSAYLPSQLLGGISGACLARLLSPSPAALALGPGPGFALLDAGAAELAFTTLLCFLVLSIATVKDKDVSPMVGLAVGSCVTAGGFSVGRISGACLNPAVALGLAATGATSGALSVGALTAYLAAELAGGAVAAWLFAGTRAGDAPEVQPLKDGAQDSERGYASANLEGLPAAAGTAAAADPAAGSD